MIKSSTFDQRIQRTIRCVVHVEVYCFSVDIDTPAPQFHNMLCIILATESVDFCLQWHSIVDIAIPIKGIAPERDGSA